MKRKLYITLGVALTSLWSIANASSVTYTFGAGVQDIGSTGTAESGAAGGTIFTTSPQGFNNGGTSPTLTVYGENAPNGLQSGADDGGPSTFSSTTGLFEVNNNGTNTAQGIAPYIASQATGSAGSLNLTNENGITETEVLLLNLSNFSAGSTVSFVMATGVNAQADTGINVWTESTTSTPTGMGVGAHPLTEVSSLTGVDVNGNPCGGNHQPSCAATMTFTLPTAISANEWIAIQADCHYLLLQSITITPGAVPEPKFYGFFAAGMIGLVFAVRKYRTRTAAEQA